MELLCSVNLFNAIHLIQPQLGNSYVCVAEQTPIKAFVITVTNQNTLNTILKNYKE